MPGGHAAIWRTGKRPFLGHFMETRREQAEHARLSPAGEQ
jgi:hypothetical protein